MEQKQNKQSKRSTIGWNSGKYLKDPEKKKAAYEKRKHTMNKKGLTCSDIVKSGYIQEQLKYDAAAVYDLSVVLQKMQHCYRDYLGKAGNRKMKKVDLSLYKSLMHHTQIYSSFCINSKLSFSCRVLLMGEFKNEPPREIFCKCGKKLCFIKRSQTFAYNSICKECKISMCSKEWFKHKYKENWIEKYNEHHQSDRMQKIYSERGRIAIQKRRERGDVGIICKGKHENEVLNHYEKLLNIKLDRNFKIAGYYPDGYCHETNTIYEVYEPYHKYRVAQDAKRQCIIMDRLKCKFVIIHHSKNFDINDLTVQEYVAK